MPSYLFNDTLQSYGAGPGFPNGFDGVGIVFGSNFIDTGSIVSPSPAPGYYEKTGIIYELFGQIAFPVNALLSNNPTSQTSVAFYTLSNDFNPGTVQLCSTNPTSPFAQIVLLQTVIEQDASISLLAPGATKANSLLPLQISNTWMLVQVTAQLSTYVSGGSTYISVLASCAVNGQVLIVNTLFLTTILVSATWNNSATINQWMFSGGPNGQFFSEFAATTDIEPLPFYPNLSGTVHCFDSQMVTEVLAKFPNGNLRLSQAITELTSNSPRNVRMSQSIVELLYNGTIVPTGLGGFYVRES